MGAGTHPSGKGQDSDSGTRTQGVGTGRRGRTDSRLGKKLYGSQVATRGNGTDGKGIEDEGTGREERPEGERGLKGDGIQKGKDGNKWIEVKGEQAGSGKT